MNRLYHAAASVRSALFCQSRDNKHTIRQLDPTLRNALAELVRDDTQSLQTEWREIEAELERARQLLSDFQAKEQFLGVRTHQYRKALDRQALVLKQQQQQQQSASPSSTTEPQEELDTEAPAAPDDDDDYAERLAQWERDADALESIVQTHTDILAQCEQMRRTIQQLEIKQKKIQSMNAECHDFVEAADRVAASMQDNTHNADQVCVEDGLSSDFRGVVTAAEVVMDSSSGVPAPIENAEAKESPVEVAPLDVEDNHDVIDDISSTIQVETTKSIPVNADTALNKAAGE